MTVTSLKRRGFDDDQAVDQAKAMVIAADKSAKARRAEAYAMDRREIERENARILNDALPKQVLQRTDEASTSSQPVASDEPVSTPNGGEAGGSGKDDPAEDGTGAPVVNNPARDGDSVGSNYNQRVEHFYRETGDLDAARKAAGAAIRRGRKVPFVAGGERQTVGEAEAEDQLDATLLPIIDRLPKITDEDHRQSGLDLSRSENEFAFNAGRAIQAAMQSPGNPNPIDVEDRPADKVSNSGQQGLVSQTNREHNGKRLSDFLALIGGTETAEGNIQLAAFAAGLDAPLKFSMGPTANRSSDDVILAGFRGEIVKRILRRIFKRGVEKKSMES